MLVDVVVGLSDGLADPVLDAVVDVGGIRDCEEEICVGDGDAKGGWWGCDTGEGGGRQNGQFVSVRFTHPRVVCDVALLADKVRLPSTFPVSSVNDGEVICGAAVT